MNTIELENIKSEAQIVDYLKRESSSKAMFNTIVDFVQNARRIARRWWSSHGCAALHIKASRTFMYAFLFGN